MTIQDSLQHPWIKVWTEETSVLYWNTLHPVKFKIPLRFYLWQSLIFETTVWVYKLRDAKSPYNWFCTTFISPRIIWILFFCFFSVCTLVVFVKSAKRHSASSEQEGVGRQHGEVQEVCSSKEMESKCFCVITRPSGSLLSWHTGTLTKTPQSHFDVTTQLPQPRHNHHIYYQGRLRRLFPCLFWFITSDPALLAAWKPRRDSPAFFLQSCQITSLSCGCGCRWCTGRFWLKITK